MSRSIHFITYGNERFAQAKKRLLKEAEDFGEFSTIKGYGPEDLPKEFVEKFAKILAQQRIGGYGIWRPIMLKEHLKLINDGEYLIYLDAGCHINHNGKQRFWEYIDLLDNSEYGIISIQMSGNKGSGSLEREYWWTTSQIFKYFNIDIISEIGASGQYLDGILVMKKTTHLEKLIDLWLKAVYDHPLMFTDYYNRRPQHPGFRDNRHEQSVFSLLRKIHGSVVIDGDETWMQPFGQGESLKYPFWATRSKT